MAKEVATTSGAVYSILAPGTRVIGNISSEDDIRIDGYLEGDVDCKGKVIIGPQSVLKGHVKCVNAEISGLLDGSILANEQLLLRGQSKVTGSIRTSTLIIEPGAVFNGSCEMF